MFFLVVPDFVLMVYLVFKSYDFQINELALITNFYLFYAGCDC